MSQLTQFRPLWCISHRGGKYTTGENTLGAFAHSLELGVDAIEIDVWQVEDELFVTHDRRLGSLIPGQGRLQDQTAAHLKSLRLACGSPIPTLQQVLELVGDRAELNIELKDAGCAQRVSQTLTAYVHDHQGSFDNYVVSSFNHHQLLQMKTLLPAVRRGVLVEGVPLDYAATCSAVQAYSFHPGLNFVTQPLIDDARQRGMKVYVYTVNAEDDFYLMSAMGIDGVFTDYPERLLAINSKAEG